jgi:hypothetical protein
LDSSKLSYAYRPLSIFVMTLRNRGLCTLSTNFSQV